MLDARSDEHSCAAMHQGRTQDVGLSISGVPSYEFGWILRLADESDGIKSNLDKEPGSCLNLRINSLNFHM